MTLWKTRLPQVAERKATSMREPELSKGAYCNNNKLEEDDNNNKTIYTNHKIT